MSFEKPPKNESHQNENGPIQFSAESGFQTLLEQLIELKAAGGVVVDQLQTFSAEEIGLQLNEAIEAVRKLAKDRNEEVSKDIFLYVPKIDLNMVPELEAISESRNLRVAVRQSLEELLKQDMGMHSAFRLDEHFLELFHQLVESGYRRI